MTKVRIVEQIGASAAAVWDCFLGSRAEELAIGVYAESVRTEGQGVGAVRISQLLGGAGEIRERIEEFDEANFLCRYRVIERGPLPYGDYRGCIRILPEAEARCTVDLSAEFEPVGASEAEAAAGWERNNRAGIARVREFLGIA